MLDYITSGDLPLKVTRRLGWAYPPVLRANEEGEWVAYQEAGSLAVVSAFYA